MAWFTTAGNASSPDAYKESEQQTGILCSSFTGSETHMKKASDRILKRSVLSVLVTAALYTPQVMAFTEIVNADNSPVKNETVDGRSQVVREDGRPSVSG